MKHMQQLSKTYTPEEWAKVAQSLEVPKNYVIRVTFVPKDEAQTKKHDSEFLEIWEESGKAAQNMAKQGYPKEKAREEFSGLLEDIAADISKADQ